MPRRRKPEVVKEGTAPVGAQGEEIQVKTERASSSQEGKGTSPSSQDVELSQSFGRNLRPRKSTCYAERDSPEVEEKTQKVPRKRRRLNNAETASDETEEPGAKASSLEQTKCALHSSLATKEVRVQLEKLEVAAIISAKKISTSGNAKGSETLDKPSSSTPSSASPKEDESKNSNAESATENPVKRPRSRRRRKPIRNSKTEAEHEGGATKVNPKIELVSPAKETDETGPIAADATPAPVGKPLTKKRIRNKKPKPNAEKEAKDSEDKPGLDVRVIKKEVPTAGESENKTQSGDSKQEEGGVTGETKENADPSLHKKPVKRKRKAKKNDASVVKENDNDPSSKVDGGAPAKVEPKEGSQDVKEKAENTCVDASKPEDTTVKKRVRRRPRKVPPIPNTSELVLLEEADLKAASTTKIEIDANNGAAKVVSEGFQNNKENEHPSGIPPIPKSCPEQLLHPTLPVPRKPGFFRGRRAKSLSSRTGKKEDIHIEESIDPEEIKGYELVERYVTPEGVKLSKFWDSEDEVSDDDSSDNFRRIMCGFGANCRVHEVIRPASEIVRRLKELQNTFGASRTLPLFPKREGIAGSLDAESTLNQEDCEIGSVQNIIWHNDPSFYSYLNNFP